MREKGTIRDRIALWMIIKAAEVSESFRVNAALIIICATLIVGGLILIYGGGVIYSDSSRTEDAIGLIGGMFCWMMGVAALSASWLFVLEHRVSNLEKRLSRNDM